VQLLRQQESTVGAVGLLLVCRDEAVAPSSSSARTPLQTGVYGLLHVSFCWDFPLSQDSATRNDPGSEPGTTLQTCEAPDGNEIAEMLALMTEIWTDLAGLCDVYRRPGEYG
jgi:hypothetical protein